MLVLLLKEPSNCSYFAAGSSVRDTTPSSKSYAWNEAKPLSAVALEDREGGNTKWHVVLVFA